MRPYLDKFGLKLLFIINNDNGCWWRSKSLNHLGVMKTTKEWINLFLERRPVCFATILMHIGCWSKKIKWNKTLIWSAWVFNCLHTMTDWIQRFNLLVKFIEIYKTLSNIYRHIRGFNGDRHLSRLFFKKGVS